MLLEADYAVDALVCAPLTFAPEWNDRADWHSAKMVDGPPLILVLSSSAASAIALSNLPASQAACTIRPYTPLDVGGLLGPRDR